MNNSIVNFHQTATSVAELDVALAKGQQNAPESKASNNRPFLRLSAEGEGWVYGMDSTAVEEGSRWAINPFSFRKGWVCWADAAMNNGKREKLGEVMNLIATPPTMPETDYSAQGGKWTEQVGFDLICIDGADAGEELSYNVNSKGGQAAFADVYKAMMERPDGDYCFPIVNLQHDNYKNKTYNSRVYVPVFKIVDWADMEENLLADSKGGKPAPEQPKRRRRTA
jgi:hypothetical protein